MKQEIAKRLLGDDADFEPPSLCKMFETGPIGVNPTPATVYLLVDNNGIVLTDNSGNIDLSTN